MSRTSTEFKFFSVSDIGQVRTTNQDFFGNKEEQNLFIVADGMGGHAGGERASHLAVETILEKYDFGGDKKPSIKSIKEVLKESIKAATRVIYEEASQDQELQQMGTTVVALILRGRNAVLGHVGDSRIYRLRGSKLEQLTVDHSFVQEQIDAGIISEADSKDHKMKNVITRALGVESDVEVDINTIRVQKGDIFLLCTDGLHGMASDEEITELMLSEPDPEKCCRALIDLANRNGGKDNVTATLVEIGKVVDDRLPILAKALGMSVAIAAGIIAVLYLFSYMYMREEPSTTGDKAPMSQPQIEGTDSASAGEPGEITPGDAGPGTPSEDAGLTVDARVAKMISLATAEIENDNIGEARAIAEKLLTLCETQDCNLELSDIENLRLRDLIANSQNIIWARKFKATNERLEELDKKELKKYAPSQFNESLAKISAAKAAFGNNELFSALNQLNNANMKMDEIVRISEEAMSGKEREVQKILEEAKRGIDELKAYKGTSYKEISVKREIVEAILLESQRRLKEDKYKESTDLARKVIGQNKQILAEARKIEKGIKAQEQRKENAKIISEKVKKKWGYIESEQFAKVGTSLSNEEYNKLAGNHKAFETQSKTGDYEKIALMGNDFLKKADQLVSNTTVALQEKIKGIETALAGKEASGKNYDRADLALGAALLEETRVLADMQLLGQALEKAEDLEELISGMKEKPTAVPAAETASEKKPERPALSPLELKKLVLASEQAGVLESYLGRSVELLQDNKKTRAKSLLQEHSKEKFENISNLLPERQKDLKKLLNDAYQLCSQEGTSPTAADVENGLKKIRLLKNKLEEIVAANQDQN